jgi:hypothetical protein
MYINLMQGWSCLAELNTDQLVNNDAKMFHEDGTWTAMPLPTMVGRTMLTAGLTGCWIMGSWVLTGFKTEVEGLKLKGRLKLIKTLSSEDLNNRKTGNTYSRMREPDRKT